MPKEPKKLTPRQRQVLNFIKGEQKKNHAPPTYGEITEFLGASSPTAAVDHVDALVRKGWVRTIPKRSRGIVVLDQP